MGQWFEYWTFKAIFWSLRLFLIAITIHGSVYIGPFKNHVENRRWVGGQKFAIFVHVQYIKNVHEGRWVVKKEQNYVHVVFEWPLSLDKDNLNFKAAFIYYYLGLFWGL